LAVTVNNWLRQKELEFDRERVIATPVFWKVVRLWFLATGVTPVEVHLS